MGRLFIKVGQGEKMRKNKIVVISLDTDNAEDIDKFKEFWNKLKVDIVIIPKSAKVIIKGKTKGGKNDKNN